MLLLLLEATGQKDPKKQDENPWPAAEKAHRVLVVVVYVLLARACRPCVPCLDYVESRLGGEAIRHPLHPTSCRREGLWVPRAAAPTRHRHRQQCTAAVVVGVEVEGWKSHMKRPPPPQKRGTRACLQRGVWKDLRLTLLQAIADNDTDLWSRLAFQRAHGRYHRLGKVFLVLGRVVGLGVGRGLLCGGVGVLVGG